MANGRRWSVSLTRRFVAIGITAVGTFVGCLGAGLGNWPVGGVGIAFVVVAISLLVISAVRGGARSFVRGTAHVVDATEPPANTPIGRCELQIVVEAPGLAPAKVKIRDTRVPVAKWPDLGDTLPIRVAIEDPRHVRILWDEVRTHGEEAADDERFQEYVQRIVDANLNDEAEEPPPAPPPSPPRRRPSPRPRRSSGGATAVAVIPSPATRTPEAPPEDDEVPVHDVVPIEGASAVLGVPPGGSDEEAVRDLLAATTAGAIHGVGVTLIVADLGRTIEFYRDKLGFTVLDGGISSAVLASGETRLMVRCVPDMPRVDRRLVHLNLEVGDIDTVYGEMLARGVKFIHRPRAVARGEHMELWAAAFRDPDGHGIALITWR